MRIVVNARFLLKDHLEGVGWFTKEVLQRLTSEHPAHEFIFLFDRPYDDAFLFNERIQAVLLPPPARHPLLWLWWFEVAVPFALRKYRADIFLSFDGYCSLRSRVPTVMVTHDIAYKHLRNHTPARSRWYSDVFVPRYLRRADRIVTVSEFSKQDILSHFSIEPAKIKVACNGVRDGFQPLPADEQAAVRAQYAAGQPYFFYIGSVHPRKNVHRLIAAFDQFKKNTAAPVKLLIGGRFAWQTGAVKTAFEAAQHQQDIHFLGYISDVELTRLTGAALALTYVSLFEGFGVPILEAMHCHTPVITSNTSSMPEVAGDAALLVNPTDVADIAAAMQRLYEDEALRNELIIKGNLQKTQFSWRKATDVIWESMLELAEE